jgi:D-glycero-D-manno-heptose 1,7-bisphosphate phosphatase
MYEGPTRSQYQRNTGASRSQGAQHKVPAAPLSATRFGRFWYFLRAGVALTIPPELNMNRAVFLDRDGTIIEERNYLRSVEEVAIFPGAAAALGQLVRAGFKLFIVSNQSGVGRGYFTLAEVERVNQYLLRELGHEGARFEQVYIAPEAPGAPSRGRKPSPQFLLDARDEFGVDLTQSYMIGDKLIDLECGWNAGVKQCLLVRTGYGAELERASVDKLGAAAVVDDLSGAAQWILKQS